MGGERALTVTVLVVLFFSLFVLLCFRIPCELLSMDIRFLELALYFYHMKSSCFHPAPRPRVPTRGSVLYSSKYERFPLKSARRALIPHTHDRLRAPLAEDMVVHRPRRLAPLLPSCLRPAQHGRRILGIQLLGLGHRVAPHVLGVAARP